VYVPLKHLATTLEVLGNVLFMHDRVHDALEVLERGCPLLELFPERANNAPPGCYDLLKKCIERAAEGDVDDSGRSTAYILADAGAGAGLGTKTDAESGFDDTDEDQDNIITDSDSNSDSGTLDDHGHGHENSAERAVRNRREVEVAAYIERVREPYAHLRVAAPLSTTLAAVVAMAHMNRDLLKKDGGDGGDSGIGRRSRDSGMHTSDDKDTMKVTSFERPDGGPTLTVGDGVSSARGTVDDSALEGRMRQDKTIEAAWIHSGSGGDKGTRRVQELRVPGPERGGFEDLQAGKGGEVWSWVLPAPPPPLHVDTDTDTATDTGTGNRNRAGPLRRFDPFPRADTFAALALLFGCGDARQQVHQ